MITKIEIDFVQTVWVILDFVDIDIWDSVMIERPVVCWRMHQEIVHHIQILIKS